MTEATGIDSGTDLIKARRREAVVRAVGAIDRLNSWVRSDSYRHSSCGAREAVYWLKNRAIRALHGYGLTTHRGVFVRVTCRDCGGTGKYIDSWGHEHPHCRACDSSGTVRLNFVETRISDGPTWHSPWLKFPLRTPAYDEAVEVGGWAPNLPGEDMEPWEVARDLNEAEEVFPERPGMRFTDWGEYDPFAYKLFVGSSSRNICDLCGHQDEGGCGCHCSLGRIAWCAYACRVCLSLDRHETGGAGIFDRFTLPRSFIDHPSILEWISRHPAKPKRKREERRPAGDDGIPS